MTSHEKVNLFLLVLNSNFAIITGFMLITIVLYLVWQARENHLSWKDWAVSLPLGMTVALAMYVENFGQLIVRVTTWIWRWSGATAPFDYVQQRSIGLGSVIGLIGLLMLIRAISKPRFGERIWLTAVVFAAVNTVWTIYVFAG